MDFLPRPIPIARLEVPGGSEIEELVLSEDISEEPEDEEFEAEELF